METMNRPMPLYRLWIATYDDRRPTHWNHVPARATALEPVADALYTAAEAALFLSGFNAWMLEHERPIWAMAVPIAVRFEGDAVPGQPIAGVVFPDTDHEADAPDTGGSEHPVAPASCPVTPGNSVTSGNSVSPGSLAPPVAGDQLQGLDQSPQRSR